WPSTGACGNRKGGCSRRRNRRETRSEAGAQLRKIFVADPRVVRFALNPSEAACFFSTVSIVLPPSNLMRFRRTMLEVFDWPAHGLPAVCANGKGVLPKSKVFGRK